MVAISSKPYLTSDFAFLPCFNILIGFIFMFTNEIRPYKSHAYHRHKSCDTLHVAHMGVLDVEAGGFHGLESGLDLPSFPIGQDSTLGTVEAYEDLQFRDSLGVLDPASGKIDILAFVEEEFMIKFLLSDPEVIEEPPCTYPLAGGRLDNPEDLSDTDIIPDTTAVEPSYPFLSDELAVCHKAVDAVRSEKTDKSFHYLAPFFPIGVAPFRKKAEYQREGNSFIGDAQHEDIDIELSELPVGTVHAQHEFCLDWQQRENHAGNDVEVKNILGKKSLEPSEVGILVDSRRHRIRQLMETHRLHYTEGMEEQRHKLYASQIHIFSKMFLHNREDFVNFDQVLGFSSFHGEKSANFSFKLLIFKDFYKYNRLKFRCLTA